MLMKELWGEVEEALIRLGDGVAVIDLNIIDHISQESAQQWTGHQLLSLIDSLAALIDQITHNSTGNLPPRLAIYLENSAPCIAAVLAAIKCGWAYLPIDPRWPHERVKQTLQRFTPSALLYGNNNRVPGGCGRPMHQVALEQNTRADVTAILQDLSGPSHTDVPRTTEQECGYLEITPTLLETARSLTVNNSKRPALARDHKQDPKLSSSTTAIPRSSHHQIAYVMTTSGSTGTPLGVLGTTAGIVQRCRWMQQAYPWQHGDLVAFKTSLCFVDSVWEIFGPLLCSTPVLAVPYQVMANPSTFLEVLSRYKATHLTAVPSYWRLLLRCMSSKEGPKLNLRQVVSSGEQLSVELLGQMQAKLPSGCRIINLYGTTEVAADATVLDCTALDELSSAQTSGGTHSPFKKQIAVPVGMPLPGVIVSLLKLNDNIEVDEEESEQFDLLPAVVGSQGEIVIGGWGLANGYFPNDSNDSKPKFISMDIEAAKANCMPMQSMANFPWSWDDYVDTFGRICLFRTGDLGTINATGRVCILGRLDLQVKIRGARVDLSEVESALSEHPAVRAAAVKAWPAESAQDGRSEAGLALAAYIEPEAGVGVDVNQELQRWCTLKLLPAAVPLYFLYIDVLPRSPAGKIDRSVLQPPPQISTTNDITKSREKRKREYEGSRILPQLSERAVHAVFAEALGHTSFEPTTSLFACGGTSLTAAMIANALSIDVEKVFQFPSVRSLVANACEPDLAQPELVSGLPQEEERKRQYEAEMFGNDILKIKWRAKMVDCVDAPPLSLEGHPYCWAASHGGKISCLDIATGTATWQRNIAPEQPDPGMVVVPYNPALTTLSSEEKLVPATCSVDINGPTRSMALVVGMNSGNILILDAYSGEELGNFNIGNGMRAGPAVDPWAEQGVGLIWAAGHGRRLVIAEPPTGSIIATLALPAAVSAGIAFDTRISNDHMAFVGCLDGSLVAVAARKLPTNDEMTGAGARSVDLSVAWQHNCGAPIFATPTVISPLDDDDDDDDGAIGPLVVVLTATGEALALRNSQVMWRCTIDPSGFFLPPFFLPQDKILIVGSHGGNIAWIDALYGRLKAPELRRVGSFLSSSAAAVTGLLQVHQPGHGPALVVLTATGEILLYDNLTSNAVLVASLKLPAAAFALGKGPSMQSIIVGCRDDHVYLIYIS